MVCNRNAGVLMISEPMYGPNVQKHLGQPAEPPDVPLSSQLLAVLRHVVNGSGRGVTMTPFIRSTGHKMHR
jgi:hypothetical protein